MEGQFCEIQKLRRRSPPPQGGPTRREEAKEPSGQDQCGLVSLPSKVGIKTITNNQREWLQHLVEIRCTQLDSDYISSLNGLRLCEKNCLIKTIGYCVDLEKVNIKIDEAYFRLITEVNVSLPTPEFFESIGITESSARHTFISNLIRIIEDAGIVQFVAITGWRESEFGFSLNDIKCYPNNDLLDQYACPVRYEIQWKVPKTNGDTKLCREITRAAYSCALRLAELVRGKEHSPCLYSCKTSSILS